MCKWFIQRNMKIRSVNFGFFGGEGLSSHFTWIKKKKDLRNIEHGICSKLLNNFGEFLFYKSTLIRQYYPNSSDIVYRYISLHVIYCPYYNNIAVRKFFRDEEILLILRAIDRWKSAFISVKYLKNLNNFTGFIFSKYF